MCSSEKTSLRRRKNQNRGAGDHVFYCRFLAVRRVCERHPPRTIDFMCLLTSDLCIFLSVSSRKIMISMLAPDRCCIPAEVRSEHQNAVERRGRVEIAAVARQGMRMGLLQMMD